METIEKIKRRITSIPVKKYCAKGYRKISHRKGYGVHSPFVYCLITKIIEEKAAYYRYADIENAYFRTKTVLGDKLPVKLQTLKASKLLFRLANRFKPDTILECGTSYGVSTLALAYASPEAALTVIEPNAGIMALAAGAVPGADVRCGTYEEELVRFLSGCRHPDFIYIRNQASAADYKTIFSILSPHIPESAVIVTEGIRKDKEVYEIFCGFTAHDRVKIVMDLYDIAILIASPKLNKGRYKESF